MRLAALLVALAALAGCGNSGIEGTLEWAQEPSVSAHALVGRVGNTTSHSVTLDPKSMRLLDDRGHRVPGRIEVGVSELAANASTRLGATWKSGKPVRIDYGAGALALPSG
jgi:hypothetical protein